MTRVRLQTDDVDRLTAAQRVLLSPLDHEDVKEWQLQANHAVRRFVGADHSVFSLPTGPTPVLHTDDTDPALPERFLTYFAGVIAGHFKFRDPLLERAEQIRRTVGPAAFHELDLGSRDAIERSVAFQEVFRSSGLTNQIALSMSLPEAEATQFFGYDGAAAERRSERGLELLRLLVPAFEAGVRMQRRWQARGAAFAAALDATDQAAALYSAEGAPLHRTDALRGILDDEPASDLLEEHMDALARALGARRPGNGSTGIDPIQPHADVCGAVADYRLQAVYLDPALLGVEAILVTVRRLGPPLPPVRTVAARFALTAREAEVALMLAHGLSDAAIAQRLAISPHTARRHSERVLRKLDLHSRAAVAVTLLRLENG